MITRSVRASRMRGVATIEAAIGLPILLFLMLATVELGRAFVQYTVLADSVRNGARHVAGRALLGTTGKVFISPTLLTEARNLVVYGNEAGTGSAHLPGFQTSQVSVTNVAGTNDVRINALYPYQPLLGPQLGGFGTGSATSMVFNMSITVTMRAL